jgi:hypothetical protein
LFGLLFRGRRVFCRRGRRFLLVVVIIRITAGILERFLIRVDQQRHSPGRASNDDDEEKENEAAQTPRARPQGKKSRKKFHGWKGAMKAHVSELVSMPDRSRRLTNGPLGKRENCAIFFERISTKKARISKSKNSTTDSSIIKTA